MNLEKELLALEVKERKECLEKGILRQRLIVINDRGFDISTNNDMFMSTMERIERYKKYILKDYGDRLIGFEIVLPYTLDSMNRRSIVYITRTIGEKSRELIEAAIEDLERRIKGPQVDIINYGNLTGVSEETAREALGLGRSEWT